MFTLKAICIMCALQGLSEKDSSSSSLLVKKPDAQVVKYLQHSSQPIFFENQKRQTCLRNDKEENRFVLVDTINLKKTLDNSSFCPAIKKN